MRRLRLTGSFRPEFSSTIPSRLADPRTSQITAVLTSTDL